MPDDLTIIIKTFDRPERLRALLRSIPEPYRNLPSILSDDGRTHYAGELLPNMIHQKHEYDIGLSEGRNRAVRACQTKFFLTLDDDMLWTNGTEVDSMLHACREGRVSLCSGRVKGFPNTTGIFKNYEDADGNRAAVLEHKPRGVPVYDLGHAARYLVVHAGVNFFVADRDAVLGMGAWTPEVKIIHEHFTFFYRFYRADLRMSFSDIAFIGHPRYMRRGEYKRKRLRHEEFKRAAFEAKGVNCFIKKLGRRTIWRGDVGPFDWSTAKRTEKLPL